MCPGLCVCVCVCVQRPSAATPPSFLRPCHYHNVPVQVLRAPILAFFLWMGLKLAEIGWNWLELAEIGLKGEGRNAGLPRCRIGWKIGPDLCHLVADKCQHKWKENPWRSLRILEDS